MLRQLSHLCIPARARRGGVQETAVGCRERSRVFRRNWDALL